MLDYLRKEKGTVYEATATGCAFGLKALTGPELVCLCLGLGISKVHCQLFRHICTEIARAVLVRVHQVGTPSLQDVILQNF